MQRPLGAVGGYVVIVLSNQGLQKKLSNLCIPKQNAPQLAPDLHLAAPNPKAFCMQRYCWLKSWGYTSNVVVTLHASSLSQCPREGVILQAQYQ
jgi:hypothetical protein